MPARRRRFKAWPSVSKSTLTCARAVAVAPRFARRARFVTCIRNLRDNGKRLRNMLAHYAEQGGENPIVFFHTENSVARAITCRPTITCCRSLSKSSPVSASTCACRRSPTAHRRWCCMSTKRCPSVPLRICASNWNGPAEVVALGLPPDSIALYSDEAALARSSRAGYSRGRVRYAAWQAQRHSAGARSSRHAITAGPRTAWICLPRAVWRGAHRCRQMHPVHGLRRRLPGAGVAGRLESRGARSVFHREQLPAVWRLRANLPGRRDRADAAPVVRRTKRAIAHARSIATRHLPVSPAASRLRRPR